MMVSWFDDLFRKTSLVISNSLFRCFLYIISDLNPINMAQRTLRFKIRQDGRVEETVEGIIGNGCIELTEKLEAALGSVEQRKTTSDSFLRKEVQKQIIPAEIH